MIGCTCHILAGNNQDTITACMESVVQPGLFSEILVCLDTKSKDATGELLRYYAIHYSNVKVLSYGWRNPPDFAAVRNDGIKITRTPYAFWLDSDETLKKPEQLRSMLARARGQAFKMWVRSPVGGGRFHDMFQPRLFPVRPGVHFECPVFERIDWSLERQGVPMELTHDDPIWHDGYVDAQGLESKNKRNMRIMKKYLREHRANDPQRQHIVTQYNRMR